MKQKNKIWNYLFKVVIITLSYLYIIHRFKEFDFSGGIIFNYNLIHILVFVLLLMFVNWSIEAIKWQLLIKKVEKISFFDSLKSVLIGIIFGLFTPNRIGEIGGRSIYLKPSNRVKGIVVACIGSFAQMTVTVVLGLFGFSIIFFFFGAYGIRSESLNIFASILLVLAVLMTVLFFNPDIFIKILSFLRIPKKFIEKASILTDYSNKILVITMFLSMLRYLVFVFQYYLLLKLFNVEIDFFIAIAGIFSVFLLMNVLPNIVIADLGIRGSVSIFVLGQFAENLQGILMASILLWVINVLLPVFAGQFLFLKNKTQFLSANK